MTPDAYLTHHDLYDLERLRVHAQAHSVYVITSPRFPDLVMLHYMDSCQYDNTWTEFSRMSRGLILDLKAKVVLAHPFDKFFNLGQMPETQYDVLQWKMPFTIAEKLDGSMLILFRDPTTGLNHLTTKGSFDSEHGLFATSIMPDALKSCTRKGTFIFELIEKRFQIVINYGVKGYPYGLYLTGYRNEDGKLVSYEELTVLAKELGVFVPKEFAFLTLDSLIENSQTLSVLEEGYVLRFKDDTLVKVKGPAYLKMHRFISRLSDKNILEACKTGEDQVLIEIAPEEYRDEIVAKVAFFKRQREFIDGEIKHIFESAPRGSRKDFAFWVNSNVKQDLKSAMFTLLDGKPLSDIKIYSLIGERENVSGATRI